MPGWSTALEIAGDVRTRQRSCVDTVEATLADIEAANPALNAFVSVAAEKARGDARDIDKKIAAGETLGPLAGVPFAVKDLLDVKGEITKAGAYVRETAAPARRDALLVRRLKAAGGIYIGRLNMDEFAYGFATVNKAYGTTRNPYDTERLAGGSSGGSAAAVAADLVPLTLGSDTNGSVRVPASLCGLFGLRPSFDSLPMSGVFPFVDTLDTVGPFARTLDDLEAIYAVLSKRKPRKRLKKKLKFARLDGWFSANCDPEGLAGLDTIAEYLRPCPSVTLRHAEAGRSAAFLVTSKAGGVLHRATLKDKALDYDSAVRDRLIAGCALPDSWVEDAKAVAQIANDEIHNLLATYDVVLAPATPSCAPRIDEGEILIDGKRVSARANLGLYTQPLSPAGVPILTVPLYRPGKLPFGLQLIAKKGGEPLLFAAARRLVDAGLIGFTPPLTHVGGATS